MGDSQFLSDLSKKLKRIRQNRLATQEQMASYVGVSQETVSKVANLKRRRSSPALVRLNNYADMLLDTRPPPISAAVSDAVREFLSFGSEDELVASIRMCANLASGRAPARRRSAHR